MHSAEGVFREKGPRDEITYRYSHGKKVVEVDTSKARYKGTAWKDLGTYGKRKYENLVFIENMSEPIQICYR